MNVFKKRAAIVAAVVFVFTMVATGSLQANHGHGAVVARNLELSPEITSTASTAETYDVTAKIPSAPTTTEIIEVDLENVTVDNTPEQPDFECQIAVGATSCLFDDIPAPSAGTFIFMGWIDHDGQGDPNQGNEVGEGDSTEADRTEGRYSGQYPGAGHPGDCTSDDSDDCPGVPAAGTVNDIPAGDLTDVISLTWTTGAARLSCDPEAALNPRTGEGSSETYICFVTDAAGRPVEGELVDGENQGGANDGDGTDGGTADFNAAALGNGQGTPPGGCTTDIDGKCSWTVGGGNSGAAQLCFWVDDNDNLYSPAGSISADGGECNPEAEEGIYIRADGTFEVEGNDLTDQVRKVWKQTIAGDAYFGFDTSRDIELLPRTSSFGVSGYILTGSAEIHRFGAAPTVFGGPSWPGGDVARDLVLTSDTNEATASGYVLDLHGGVHPFGGAPAIASGPYWRGADVARDMELIDADTTGGVSGYILDLHGGIHPFKSVGAGDPPAVTSGPYWGCCDIARDLELFGTSLFGEGTRSLGYVLDGQGGIHSVNGADPMTSGPYWPFDIANDLEVVVEGAAMVLDGFGGVHPAGSSVTPASSPSPAGGPYWGFDIARGIEGFDAGLHVLDGHGGRFLVEYL